MKLKAFSATAAIAVFGTLAPAYAGAISLGEAHRFTLRYEERQNATVPANEHGRLRVGRCWRSGSSTVDCKVLEPVVVFEGGPMLNCRWVDRLKLRHGHFRVIWTSPATCG